MVWKLLEKLANWFTSSQGKHLRPPGALDEAGILATCIKCGKCMEICPYQSIFLTPWQNGPSYGTPLINPLKNPCYLCMKCPEVCPTGTLRPLEKEKVNMGQAKIQITTCLSYNDTMCNLCYKNCPLRGEAIILDDELRPVVENACVGCGVCLFVCPTETKSILLTVEGTN